MPKRNSILNTVLFVDMFAPSCTENLPLLTTVADVAERPVWKNNVLKSKEE